MGEYVIAVTEGELTAGPQVIRASGMACARLSRDVRHCGKRRPGLALAGWSKEEVSPCGSTPMLSALQRPSATVTLITETPREDPLSHEAANALARWTVRLTSHQQSGLG